MPDGVFVKILQKLSKCETEILMMDATHLSKTAIRVKDRYNAANETNTRLVGINATLVERVADRDMQLTAAVEECTLSR
jgi:hypothetical protein